MKKKVILFSSLLLLASAQLASARSADSIREDIDKTKTELSQLMVELRDEEGRDNWTVGDNVELANGVLFTITDAYIDTPGEYDNFEHNMVRIDFTIDNQSEEEVSYNSHKFSLYDGDRTKTSHDSKDFFSEDIGAGMKADGTVYYDVRDLGDLTFQFEEEQWTITVE